MVLMPQADKNAATVISTVLGVGIIATVCIAFNWDRISRHIEANTPPNTIPAYDLIHTGGPGNAQPSAPIINQSYNVPPIPTTPAPMYTNRGIYEDAYVPQATVVPSAPVYPQVPTAYAVHNEAPVCNTIDYKGSRPNPGQILEILYPDSPATRRNIQFIQFNGSTEIYQLNGNIRPNSTSTFTDNQGQTHQIKWINPRARGYRV